MVTMGLLPGLKIFAKMKTMSLTICAYAEANAITKVAKSNNSSENSTLYVTSSPCMNAQSL